jgi:hypothetical protein
VNIVKYIEPHLILPDKLKPVFLEDLIRRMTQTPDTVLVLASLEGSEVKSFLIADNPGPSVPYIVLAQVWSSPDNDASWYEPYLARLLMWAVANDKEYIKAETQRNTAALFRRFGFEPFSQNVKLDVNGHLLEHPEEFLKWATSLNQT